MKNDKALRAHVARLLDWTDAHADYEAAVTGIEPRFRGTVPEGWDYSAWQLIEHIRIAQQDILEFCVASSYHEKAWPDDYWPAAPEPPSDEAWNASVEAYRRDRRALQELAANPKIDLLAVVPNGKTQTYLRELLLVADHTAYHVGQMVALRKALGIWPAG